MKCGDPTNPDGPYIRANGRTCERDVKPGFTRCYLHGGGTVTAKIKAEQMLARVRLPAIESLNNIIEQFESLVCQTCGYPMGSTDEKRMIVSACKTVLDRTGMGPNATLTIVPQHDGDLNLELLTQLEREALVGHLVQVKALKETVRARQLSAVTTPTTVN